MSTKFFCVDVSREPGVSMIINPIITSHDVTGFG
jgi:hypothetical protein